MKIIKSTNKPSPQEGNNGDVCFLYKDDGSVFCYLKQMGSWIEYFELPLIMGPKGKDGKDGKNGIDGKDGKNGTDIIFKNSDTIILKGDGTSTFPYQFSLKNTPDEIVEFFFTKSKREITLITNQGKKYIVSLQDIYNEVIEINHRLSVLEDKKTKYYLSDNLVPLSVPLERRGGGRSGLATGNYIVVPHSSYLTELTWRFLAAGPKQYTPSSIFMPHEEMGGKKPLVTIDVYSEGSLIAENLIPGKPYKFKEPKPIQGGSLIYFDVKVAEGTPYGMTVTMGFETRDIRIDKEYINI